MSGFRLPVTRWLNFIFSDCCLYKNCLCFTVIWLLVTRFSYYLPLLVNGWAYLVGIYPACCLMWGKCGLMCYCYRVIVLLWID